MAAEKADFGLIFAGGDGTRLSPAVNGNGKCDKGGVLLHGKPLFEYVFKRLSAQAEQMIIVAPSPPDWLADLPDSIVYLSDAVTEDGRPAGPLAALSVGLNFAHSQTPGALLLTAPIDSPFLPDDLFRCLSAGMAERSADAAIALSEEHLHPVFGLWRASLAEQIEHAFRVERIRALYRIAGLVGAAHVAAWETQSPPTFFNINTPVDLERARTYAAKAS